MHRSIMMCVPLLSLVGFICIWIQKKWTWVPISLSANFVHSILGILAICFAFVQPLMALFRPHKGDLSRPVFNWAHRCLGILTYILSSKNTNHYEYNYIIVLTCCCCLTSCGNLFWKQHLLCRCLEQFDRVNSLDCLDCMLAVST